MKLLVKKITLIGLCALLAACAPDGQGGTNNVFSDIQTVTSSTAGQSPEQRELAQRQRQYAQSRVSAAVVGAVGGALICALRECSSEQLALAVAGGGAAGYLAGGYLTNQNQAFQGTQETLNRDIQLARQDNERLAASVSAAQQVVNFQRSEIARLNQAYSAGTLSAEAYKARVATMQGDVRATQSLVATANERLVGLNNSVTQHSRAGLPTRELQQQRSAQQQNLQNLRQAERAMLANINRTPAQVRS